MYFLCNHNIGIFGCFLEEVECASIFGYLLKLAYSGLANTVEPAVSDHPKCQP